MKTNTRIILLTSLVLAVLLWAGYLVSRVKHDWNETYEQQSIEPYGTNLLSKLLASYYVKEGFSIGANSLSVTLGHSDLSGIHNYIFIGNRLHLSPQDADTLLAFVATGNNAFISMEYIPTEFEDALGFGACKNPYRIGTDSDSVCFMNFYHPDLATTKNYPFKYIVKGAASKADWRYFLFAKGCDSIPLHQEVGYSVPGKTNFIRLGYGKGWFYLHLNPIVFTNIQLLNESAVAYCDRVFSCFPKGRTLWDEYSRYALRGRYDTDSQDQSPLSYILSQPTLRWAWYTLLSLVLTYCVFQVSRRQRIIPVILPPENSSLEFVETVGGLYYQQHDHQKLCLQKMKLFLLFIRNRYFIPTNAIDEAFLRTVSKKSEIAYEHLEKIFSLYRLYHNTVVAVETDELIEFHKSLDYFYRNCR